MTDADKAHPPAPTEGEIAEWIAAVTDREQFIMQGPAYALKMCGNGVELINRLAAELAAQTDRADKEQLAAEKLRDAYTAAAHAKGAMELELAERVARLTAERDGAWEVLKPFIRGRDIPAAREALKRPLPGGET